MDERPSLEPLAVEGEVTLSGDAAGEGPAIVLLHGVTATRSQVVHGSNVLARGGLRMIRYDARGHGESDPAGERSDYGSPQNVADLDRLLDQLVGDSAVLLAGHSMGSHTAVARALRD